MPESRLKDGDWKCVAYTDIQRTELTVHDFLARIPHLLWVGRNRLSLFNSMLYL